MDLEEYANGKVVAVMSLEAYTVLVAIVAATELPQEDRKLLDTIKWNRTR